MLFRSEMLKNIRNKVLSSVIKKLDEINLSTTNNTRIIESVNESTYRRIRNSGSITTGSNEILAKIFTGLKIYLDPNDLAVAVHIALDGIWEENISRAWINTIKEDDTVLDIGANFGYFGLLAGQFTDKKKAKIVLFEANPNIVPYIHKSLSVNWLNEQIGRAHV